MSKTSYTTWPTRDDKREQPWALDDKNEPVQTDVEPRAGLPLLGSGSSDPAVHTLFTALAQLGYETPISRGENPYGLIGPEELAAVRQFRRDYNVQEDPGPFGGDNDYGRTTADNHVGPWTGEAILRAAEKASRGEDPLETIDQRLAALEQRPAPRPTPPKKPSSSGSGSGSKS
jgi:peptidoglycan hydrolase-like protein with peptidoglycan-binding domain